MTLDELMTSETLLANSLPELPMDTRLLPQGWMSPLELRVLYSLARFSSKDVLELGSWIGRSTTALCLGARDRQGHKPHFDVVDLGLVSVTEFIEKLQYADKDYILKDEVTRPILQSGGSIGVLIDNLRKLEILDIPSSIIRADLALAPLRANYGVVVCDAVHNDVEIAHAGPVLARALQPGDWLFCDDIVRPELQEALERHVRFDRLFDLAKFDAEAKSVFGRVCEVTLSGNGPKA